MLKKRLIFTLLYDGGSFMLSRNFRLQKVGDLHWLQRHYDFSRIAFHIDELIVLDVTRGVRDPGRFCDTLKVLTEGCFVPIAAGGGVRSLGHARQLLRSGADKVVINTALHEQPGLAAELAEGFGHELGALHHVEGGNQSGRYHRRMSGAKQIRPSPVD